MRKSPRRRATPQNGCAWGPVGAVPAFLGSGPLFFIRPLSASSEASIWGLRKASPTSRGCPWREDWKWWELNLAPCMSCLQEWGEGRGGGLWRLKGTATGFLGGSVGTLGLRGGCPGGPAPALGGILRARLVLCPGGPEGLGSRVKNALSPEGRTWCRPDGWKSTAGLTTLATRDGPTRSRASQTFGSKSGMESHGSPAWNWFARSDLSRTWKS